MSTDLQLQLTVIIYLISCNIDYKRKIILEAIIKPRHGYVAIVFTCKYIRLCFIKIKANGYYGIN